MNQLLFAFLLVASEPSTILTDQILNFCRAEVLSRCPGSVSCAAGWAQLADCELREMGWPAPSRALCIARVNTETFSKPSAYDRLPAIVACLKRERRA